MIYTFCWNVETATFSQWAWYKLNRCIKFSKYQKLGLQLFLTYLSDKTGFWSRCSKQSNSRWTSWESLQPCLCKQPLPQGHGRSPTSPQKSLRPLPSRVCQRASVKPSSLPNSHPSPSKWRQRQFEARFPALRPSRTWHTGCAHHRYDPPPFLGHRGPAGSHYAVSYTEPTGVWVSELWPFIWRSGHTCGGNHRTLSSTLLKHKI